MNPTNEGMNLPPVEQLPVPAVEQGGQPSAPERGAAPAERAGSVVRPGGAAAMPTIPLPVPQATPIVTATTDASSTTPTAMPPVGGDQDLIDKEWVTKAKQIVEQTRDDPHKQSEELTVFRADYLQSHYNKTLKLSK